MFSFYFDSLADHRKDWEIIINCYSLRCNKAITENISKAIFSNNSQQNKSKKSEDPYIITIPEFENSLICSEDDYQTFKNIFNLIPIQINSSNKNALKIFASKLEIEELLTLVKLFEEYEDIINNDLNLQILKDISNKLINITENDFDSLLEDFKNIKQEILTHDFVYNLFLSRCIVRPLKIELLMDFLKKLDEFINGDYFENFKKLIIEDYVYNPLSHELKFIAIYLHGSQKVEEMEKKPRYRRKTPSFDFVIQNFEKIDLDKVKKEIDDYKKSGFSPDKVYQAIKDDNIDLFTELMTSSGGKIDFNGKITVQKYERSSDIYKVNNYLDLAAFYGAERCFNYILLNIDDQIDALKSSDISVALIGGNISIARKYLENIEMSDKMLIDSLVTTIKYNHNELFEYLFENYDPMRFMDNNLFRTTNGMNNNRYIIRLSNKDPNEDLNFNDTLIVNAIQYNNFDAICYLLMNGFDHTSLFTLSLIYNQFCLAEMAVKLPYECKFDSDNINDKILYPFLYKYDDEPPLFISIFKNRLDFIKIIIESPGFKPKTSFEGASPLYFAVENNKLDIVKFFLEDKRFSNMQVSQRINIFEYAICHGFTELGEFLLNRSDVKKIDHYSCSLSQNVSKIIFGKLTKVSNYKNAYDEGTNFVKFFLSKSDDATTNKNKETLIKENLNLITCLAAAFSNENDFERFLDEYKVDINTPEKQTILLILFFE